MNYRHIYHAGNFADVVKHIILIALIDRLKLKEKPFTVLDAFAGTGLYDFNDIRANATKEAESGFIKLQNLDNCPLLKKYLDIVAAFNQEGCTRFYPGSPMIIRKILGDFGKLIASELHPQDYLELQNNFYKYFEEKTGLHHLDAYTALKAFLPFERGLVFLDPPFEKKNEFALIIEGLKIIKKRFLNGITYIWFPVKNEIAVKSFYNECLALGFKEYLFIDFTLKFVGEKLNKIGMIIINPPWELENDIEPALSFLANIFEANYSCKKIITT